MAWTLEEAKEMLALWLNAEKTVSLNQEYTIGNRTLVRASLGEIRKQVSFWRREVTRLESGSGGVRVRRVVARDL